MRGRTYEQKSLCPVPRGLGVFLCERDEFFRHALGLFCFGVAGGDGLPVDQGGDQVAEEGLTVGRVTAQVPVFDRGHCWTGKGKRL